MRVTEQDATEDLVRSKHVLGLAESEIQPTNQWNQYKEGKDSIRWLKIQSNSYAIHPIDEHLAARVMARTGKGGAPWATTSGEKCRRRRPRMRSGGSAVLPHAHTMVSVSSSGLWRSGLSPSLVSVPFRSLPS